MTENKEVTSANTIEFFKASYGKRLLATIIDFVCAFVIALILITVLETPMKNSSQYNSALKTANSIEEESGLYVTSDGSNIAMTSHYKDDSTIKTEDDYAVLDAKYEEALTYYYSSSDFFTGDEGTNKYLSLKAGSEAITFTKDDAKTYYFLLNSDGSASKNPNVTYTELSSFYVSVIDEYAIPSIGIQKPEYLSATKTLFLMMVGHIFLWSAVSLALFFVIFPAIVNRGHQTIGKLILQISVVDAHGFSLSKWRFIGRTAFLYIIELLLSFFSFGIPLIVSFSFMSFRKDGQALHDYVAGTYVVDSRDQVVYRDYEEMKKRQAKIDEEPLSKWDDSGNDEKNIQ